MHEPVWQVSVCVQASLSVHAVPLPWSGFEHVSVCVQALLSISERRRSPIGAPDYWQMPPTHEPDMGPFMHIVPLGTAGFEQAPLIVSHVPALWH